MASDWDPNIERICQAALDLPGAERATFVAGACGGDEDLRREVERLLSHESDARAFLETPALAIAAHEMGVSSHALRAGRQIGSYTILSSLGSGGMGEVYRARDTTLGRDVAIKVLPPIFTNDSERLTRFAREARVLAALNHPNIATIHGIERTDGIHALVLEVVEGETLEARSGRGGSSDPPTIAEALAIAKQIADALEAAHDKGVIHRDLKPANIKIRPDGVVKVLDFGLAKATGPAYPAQDVPDPSQSRPISTSHTGEGVLLGTAAYMSPEQARGKPVDRGADIWAFGVVLFEMLTGHRAFQGETFSDTVVAVLEREPDWRWLPDDTPPAVRRLLERCLQKDRRFRLRDIGDARLEIEDALLRRADTASTAGNVIKQPSRARLAWALVAALGLVLTAVTAVAAWLYVQQGRSDAPVTRFVAGFPDGWNSVPEASRTMNLAVSPDGRWVAFPGMGTDQQTALWVRELGTIAPRALSGTERAASPFWSPDSRFLGFFADGKLKKVDVSGAQPVTLCEAPDHRGGTWGSDQVIVFATSAGPLHQVSASGGTPTVASMVARGEVSHLYPSFLPDGHHFLYGAVQDDNRVRIYVTSLESIGRTLLPLNADAANVVYSRQHLLFLRQQTLMAQPFDERQLSALGEAIPIAETIRRSVGPSFSGYFSASANGVLVYQSGSAESSHLVWYDRIGRQLSVLGDSAVYSGVSLSPRGDQVAVSVADPAKLTTDIWFYDVARGLRTRFTSDPGIELAPIWSPDGNRVVFNSTRTGFAELYQKASNSAETEESLLLQAPLWQVPEDWAPDGQSILFGTNGPSGKRDLWILPLSGDRKPVPILHDPFGKIATQFSPDGRWIAYQSSESGRTEVYVAPFRRPGATRQISTDGGNIPRWRRDGTEIFFLDAANRLVAAVVDGRDTAFKIQSVRTLFQTRAKTGDYAFDVSPSGDRFLINTVAERSGAASFTVVINWSAGLEK